MWHVYTVCQTAEENENLGELPGWIVALASITYAVLFCSAVFFFVIGENHLGCAESPCYANDASNTNEGTDQ